MELIPLILFLIITTFISGKKYKQVSNNRPGQTRPQHKGGGDGTVVTHTMEELLDEDEHEEYCEVSQKARECMEEEWVKSGMKEALIEAEKNVVTSSLKDDSSEYQNSRPVRIATEEPVHKMEKTVKPVLKHRKTKKEKISINNRQEARKAFIYSEIFNRKY